MRSLTKHEKLSSTAIPPHLVGVSPPRASEVIEELARFCDEQFRQEMDRPMGQNSVKLFIERLLYYVTDGDVEASVKVGGDPPCRHFPDDRDAV